MNIFNGLEKYKKQPYPPQDANSIPESKTSKWEDIKGNAKNFFGCFGILLLGIILFSAPWWLKELFGEDNFSNIIVVIFAIVAVLFLIVLFYGVLIISLNLNQKSKPLFCALSFTC